jgi:plasmid stability protein
VRSAERLRPGRAHTCDSHARLHNHMTMIQIRNVPEDLHRALKVRAARSGTTLSAMLLAELQEIADKPTLSEWLADAERLEPVAGGETPAELVRADRDAR